MTLREESTMVRRYLKRNGIKVKSIRCQRGWLKITTDGQHEGLLEHIQGLTDRHGPHDGHIMINGQ